MYFLSLVRLLVEWRISFVKIVVSAYAGGPTLSGHYHVIRRRSRTGYTGVPHVW